MTTCTLTNPCRMEICTLKYHVGCSIVCSRTLAAEYTGNTHWLFSIANAKVMLAKSVFLTVKCHKLCTFWLSAHYYLVALNHICIEAMHRLTVCHHHIVGDVDNVVDRTQANNLELVLQPLRTLLNLATSNANASITLASLGVLNLNIDRKVGVVDCKLRAVGTMKRCVITIALEPSI